jgi:hypothetical protein
MLRNLSLLLVTAAVVSLPTGVLADDQPTAESVLQPQKLKLEARHAAEQGDFALAAEKLAQAAEMNGDTRTAQKARSLAPQAGGGSPFANFQELQQMIVDQTMNEDQTNWAAPWGSGTAGTMSIFSNGVFFGVNALADAITVERSMDRLAKAAQFARTANPNNDVHHSSDLRMVSLPRLDKAVRAMLEAGQPVPADMQTLAGISEIRYLFVFPETQDVVIAGPAGDWTVDGEGRAISSVNQRPTLQLDDLVTLSRTFTSGSPFFMCSIDPKQQQIAAVKDFVRRNQNNLNRRTVRRFTQQLEQQLGLQDVVVQGIPADSRVAAVIVNADYRMKEIGIGKRQGPAGMKSYFDLLTRSEQRGSGSMDALRWWMAVGYDGINVSPDAQVFEFAGETIQCLSENQFVARDGSRQSTGKADRPNAEFARLFTEHLPELAKADPVFADLQNIFDLATVTALIHTNGLADAAGWKVDSFVASDGLQPRKTQVPEELMTAAAYEIYSGGSIVIQVAGGVRVDVADFTRDAANRKTVEALAGQAPQASPIGQSSNRWWWDAAQR